MLGTTVNMTEGWPHHVFALGSSLFLPSTRRRVGRECPVLFEFLFCQGPYRVKNGLFFIGQPSGVLGPLDVRLDLLLLTLCMYLAWQNFGFLVLNTNSFT